MDTTTLDGDTEVRTLDIEVPAWIDQAISIYDVQAINQGGCSSGAYMPAVTYHEARETMNEHGDDVLDYIEDAIGDLLPAVPKGTSWSGLAVYYLSVAVELWASGAASQLEELDDDA